MLDSWRKYLRLGTDTSIDDVLRFQLPDSCYWSADDEGDAERNLTLEELQGSLDAGAFGRVVLNPGTAPAISGINTTDLAAELARATNEWTVNEWLDRDERLLGSIVIAPHDPSTAAAEIRRAAVHPRMVQITVAYPRQFLGSSFFEPVHEAASDSGLAINLQGGAAFTGINMGYAAGGHPESMFEYRLGETYGAQPHLISMIAQAVFDRYPNLRLVLNGFGLAWLPSVIWRMDMEYERDPETRAELSRAPSEYVRDFVRIGTRGLELPGDPDHLTQLLSLVGGAQLLLMSGGVGGAAVEAPAAVTATRMSENARALYRVGDRPPAHRQE